MNKLVAWWNAQPHWFQAVIVLFGGTILGSVAKEVTTPNACMTWVCWKQYLADGLRSGVAAVAGLYVKSSFYQH